MTRARPTAVLSAVAASVLAVALLAGCGSGSGSGPSSRATSSAPAAPSVSASTGGAVTAPPVSTGPTTAATAKACPYAAQSFVHTTVGMRLGRVTVLRSGGKVVGCRIYALQTGSLHTTEHLPGPNQPAVEITTERYPSVVTAHNGFVLRARAGTNPQQIPFGDVTGVCFQNEFDPQDKGTDWACIVNKGTTVVLVRTVDNTGSFNTANLMKTVLRAV